MSRSSCALICGAGAAAAGYGVSDTSRIDGRGDCACVAATKQTLKAPASAAAEHRRVKGEVRMQGSLLLLFAGEPPRVAYQFGQASLARHLYFLSDAFPG